MTTTGEEKQLVANITPDSLSMSTEEFRAAIAQATTLAQCLELIDTIEVTE